MTYLSGWYPEESDGFRTFRWMGKNALCSVSHVTIPGQKYLLLTAGHSFEENDLPILEVIVNGRKIGTKEIQSTFFTYVFPFEEEGDLSFEFRLNRSLQVFPDSRELGIMVRKMEIASLCDPEGPLYGPGWYEWEDRDMILYRWMSSKAEVFFSSGQLKKKYFSFFAYSEFANLTQKLKVSLGEEMLCEISLLHKWNYYSFSPSQMAPLPQNQGETLTLSLNKVIPEKYHPDDKRQLGIRVGRIEFHENDELHRTSIFFHKNALLNDQEMRAGKHRLTSYPLNLGVDLYAKCNVNPPCVYCLWERMKALEGKYVNQVVDEATLGSYGPFFASARILINCSFGEPLLHPRLQQILEFCQMNKKILEISTNGQAFTSRTIQALVGKTINLYVSLDAATKETYAKIRNDAWNSIIRDLKRLNQERKKAGNLPKLFMVFMPMKVNQDELEAYFRLCQEIEADALVLRPLLYFWKPQMVTHRGGYHFDYEKELLGRQEIVKIIENSEKFSKIYRIPIANQFAFGIDRSPQ